MASDASRSQYIDETPVAMLDSGEGKAKKAYVWGYFVRSVFDAQPCIVYEFYAGRGGRNPVEFLQGCNGPLARDDYAAYGTVAKIGERKAMSVIVISKFS